MSYQGFYLSHYGTWNKKKIAQDPEKLKNEKNYQKARGNEIRKPHIGMKANIADNKNRKNISERPTIHPRKVKDSRQKSNEGAIELNRSFNPKTKSRAAGVSDISVRKRTLSRGAKKIQSVVESKTSKKASPSMMNRKQVSERELERLRKKKQRA